MTSPEAPPDSDAGDEAPLVDEVIAFYLPQFHPTAENDEFWGPGFSEWTNVAAARPLFEGHRQPRLPADLGFYDLRLAETRADQAALARRAGVTAFCYWHYWFAGREVLSRPLREVVSSGEPTDVSFCVGWANQSWTGVWHGEPDRVLIEQTYPGVDDHRRHFDALLPALSDPRYLRVDGRPLLYLFDPRAVPDLPATLELWREMAGEAGLGDLYLVGQHLGGPWLPAIGGLDGSVAVRLPPLDERKRATGPTVVDHRKWAAATTSLAADEHFPCVVAQWDNTPRSGRDGLVLTGSTPELFREQVAMAARKLEVFPPGQRLLWLKSWNEWAEGNMVEPDRDEGHGYLVALRAGLDRPAPSVPARAAAAWRQGGPTPRRRLVELALRHAAGESPLRRRVPSPGAVPVVLSIDCEPDARLPDPSAPPDLEGFLQTVAYFQRWRERAAEVTGAPVVLSWFLRMDEQMERTYGSASAFADRHGDVFAELQAAGDELGIHPHAFRWDQVRAEWIADLSNPAWLLDNLHRALDGFRRSFGMGPTLLRYGDSVLSDELVASAEAAGVRYDLTLEPGRPSQPLPEPDERTWGRQPDWRRVPRRPYAPSPQDYRRAAPWGTRDLTMVPLTSSFRWPGRSVRARVGALRQHGLHGRLQRQLLYMALPDWEGKDSFDQMAKRSLAAQRRRPYLAFAVRSDRALHVERWQRIERHLDDLLVLHREQPLVFCSPADACRRLGLAVLHPSAGSQPLNRS